MEGSPVHQGLLAGGWMPFVQAFISILTAPYSPACGLGLARNSQERGSASFITSCGFYLLRDELSL